MGVFGGVSRCGLLVVAFGACDGGEGGALEKRVEQLEEQLTAARNDLMKLRKRVDELEAAEPVAGPLALPFPSGTELTLPQARPGVELPPAAHLSITASEVMLDGQAIADDELDDALKKRAGSDPDLALVLSADDTVDYARVVHLMDRAKAAGFSKLSLAVEKGAVAPPPEPLPK